MNIPCNRLLVALLVFFQVSDEQKEPRIERYKLDGLEIELFRNSPTISRVVAINNHGSVIGTREVIHEAGGSLRALPFYEGKHGLKDIPTPPGYTNLEVVGISDTELVIGYATRPIGNRDGALRGVVWDGESNRFSFLPRADGDMVNQPQDISSDGKRITGYSTGPNRMRPALWEFQNATGEWQITVLPTEYDNNPFLMSGHLRISPDGKRIAGCCTEEIRSDGEIDNALFLWTENELGHWKREKLSGEHMYLRGINDKGEMAGSVSGNGAGRLPCFVSPRGEFLMLELLTNDVSGEVNDINNNSIMIGFSNDPIGGDGSPELCIWTIDGNAKRFAKPGSSYGTIEGINDSGQMAGMIEVDAEATDESTDTEGLLLGFRTVR